MTIRVCAAVVLSMLLCGCSDSTKIEDLTATEITFPSGKKILAETMRKDFDLTRGMMYRESLDKDRGMLFVHQQPGRYPYFMYNCKIPLDILWMDNDKRIVEISPNTPPCTSTSAKQCPTYGGHETARYVLELNSGGAAMFGLKLGDAMSF